MSFFVILIESLSGHLTVLSNFYDVYIFVLEPEYFITIFPFFFEFSRFNSFYCLFLLLIYKLVTV